MTLPKLLLVDDEPDLVWVIQFYLQSKGHEVLTAEDGLTAVQVAVKHRPDLILLDIDIPHLSGLQVRQDLRSRPAFESVPILFLSVWTDSGFGPAQCVSGCDDFLTKPFRLDQPEARIRALYSGSQAHESLELDPQEQGLNS